MEQKVKAIYFQEKEFNKCTPPCSLQDMNQDFMKRLDNARRLAGIPFVLSSAYRSKQWEYSHNRKGTSSHTEGRAVDILCNSPANRFSIINSLIKAGFSRFGVADSYIHVDDSPTHAQNVVWTYK